MANTFKNKVSAGVGTSTASVYTCPSATTAVVIGVTLCNLKSSGIEGTLQLTDTSAGATVSILKDAPIIIMDEATSALDSHSEKLIQESLEHLLADKTCIVIAHRLSTIKAMDRIIVLEDGRIIQDGSHGSLVRKVGLYKELWSLQQDGFIVE